ncbi:cell division protein ZapA [Tropicimonas sp. IMCC34043]|uniref:cell division protein ZapA n=1 Tax=Tropicimonas sp. IMCC34043 TaxID=2248760 RepID=UPI000E264E33|nr:cell division protein ZapA [Tropicimonas sp. IMCC34043]
MPEVKITIGGKDFAVACQEGEEPFLQSAAAMLDREAQTVMSQIGRMPEVRMLLMAGLMLADRTAAYEERAEAAEEKLARQERLIEEMKSMPRPEPERIEVVPAGLTRSLADMVVRAEALADLAEEKMPG